jgi:hypothetical protein
MLACQTNCANAASIPTWLALARERLDAAVALAYGWPASTTDKQILERLLDLNLERAAEEAKAYLAGSPFEADSYLAEFKTVRPLRLVLLSPQR